MERLESAIADQSETPAQHNVLVTMAASTSRVTGSTACRGKRHWLFPAAGCHGSNSTAALCVMVIHLSAYRAAR